MDFLPSVKEEKKTKREIYVRDDVWRRFKVATAQLDVPQGKALEYLLNLYKDHNEQYNVAIGASR